METNIVVDTLPAILYLVKFWFKLQDSIKSKIPKKK